MKTMYYVRICFSMLILISVLTMIQPKVSATTSFCDQHFDHGPTLTEIIGKKQCENTINQINYNGANLTVINLINKTTFRIGENITVIPELTNFGTHNVTIGYCGSLFVTLTIDQSGKIVWPQYAWACPLFQSSIILTPNSSTPGESSDQIITINTPGNYTVRSIAIFGDTSHNSILLWSEPLQITILPEKVPEFPVAIPILLISIILAITFYRMKFADSSFIIR